MCFFQVQALFLLSCVRVAAQISNVPRTRKQINAICLNSSKNEKITMLGQPAMELEPVNAVYRFHGLKENDLR